MQYFSTIPIWFMLTTLLLAQPVVSVEGLRLPEAVQRALDQNPLLRATAAGKAAAVAGVKEAEAGRLPFLQFSETYTHSNNPVFVFGSLLEQSRFSVNNFDPGYLNNPGAMSNFRTSLDLRIPVFNRFQVSSGIEKAHLKEGQAEADTQWVQQQIRFQVIQTYYGVLVADAREEVAAEAVQSAEAEVKRIRDRFDQGMVVQSDLLAMEVQLAEFKQQAAQAAGDVKTARAALNTVLAQPVSTQEVLQGQLEEQRFPARSQAELVSLALENRPDYRRSEIEVQLARQDLKTTKGQYWPDLNLFGQVGHSTQTFANGSGDFAVGAKLTFKILDFGRGARSDQISAASEAARAQEQHKANEIQFEVVKAYQNFLTAQEKVTVAVSAVDQAEETLRIVKDRHGVGLTTITEVLRSQTALLRARLNLLASRYEYYVGYAQTLLAAGILTDANQFSS